MKVHANLRTLSRREMLIIEKEMYKNLYFLQILHNDRERSDCIFLSIRVRGLELIPIFNKKCDKIDKMFVNTISSRNANN